MNRFYVSSFVSPNGKTYASVVDFNSYEVVYSRVDSEPARQFVKDYAKSLNEHHSFIPVPIRRNIIGGD